MAEERPSFDPSRIGGDASTKTPVPRTLTVSQLNTLIKQVLGDHLPGTVHLVGEISNFSRASSGHLYLTLKDDRSEIRAVMWKSAAAALKFQPADGLEVIATGYVDVYETRGQYQFYVRKLEPRGVGALELAFRQLQQKLAAEGLFDSAHKKPIPRFPSRIAVVTSPIGAAIRDILQTIRRRFPRVDVFLYPVPVQGEGAAQQIAAAIERLNRQAAALGGFDVMIVARGGGSLEDLWSFNEEVVARAIHASRIPVISGVGHEVDVTIADLVADLRAPTPTAAAELAVPVLTDLLESLSTYDLRLRRTVGHRLDLARSRLAAVERFEWFRDPLAMLRRAGQRIDETTARLQLSGSRMLQKAAQRLHRLHLVLAGRHPGVLLRQHRNRHLELTHHLRWVVEQRLRLAERRISHTKQTLLLVSPASHLEARHERILQLSRRLDQACVNRFRLISQALDALRTRLEAGSHHRILARGFTITRSKRGRRIITDPGQVAPGDSILTETASGEIQSRVTDSRQLELFD